jgi:hypothetical protein
MTSDFGVWVEGVDGLEESIFLVYGSKNIISLHLLADGLHQPKRVNFLLIVIFGILLYRTNDFCQSVQHSY